MIAPGLTNKVAVEQLNMFVTYMERDKKKINEHIRKMKKRIRELEKLPPNENMVGKFFLPITLS